MAKKKTVARKTRKKTRARKSTGVGKGTKKAAARKKPAKKVYVKEPATKKKHAKKKVAVYKSVEEVVRVRAANWPELAKQRQRAQEILDKYRDELLKRQCVTGAHVGFKQVGGMTVKPLQYVIVIHVSVKRPKNDPLLTDVLDGELDGVATDVIEMSFRSAVGTGKNLPQSQTFHPVLQGGIAISREKSPRDWGTLGMIVFDSLGKPTFLTNQHVAGTTGDDIRQPPLGNIPPGESRIIGQTSAESLSLLDDCAIIAPNGHRNFDHKILGINLPLSAFSEGQLTEQDELQTVVIKVGAKTGLTKGVVQAIAATVNVPDQGTFVGQIVVGGSGDLILPGDSGAVLLKEKKTVGGTGYQVVGLVHAMMADPPFLVATHFMHVKSSLGISID